jgi:hypothetical protein
MEATLLPSFEERSARGGAVVVENPAPGILCCRVTGEGDDVIARAILRGTNAVYASSGRIQIFHDWLGVTGYTSDARKLLTDWTRERRVNTTVSMLFNNRFLAMGVSVAALAVPGLVSFSDPAIFAAARDAAITAARRGASTGRAPAEGHDTTGSRH